MAITLYFWDSWFVFPVKLFVVLLHEISHGLMALITGGEILKIEINENQGGICWHRGGSFFWVASAGYLGSMFWGGLILLIAAKTKYDSWVMGLIGLSVLLITLLYIRNLYGMGFGILFGVGLLLLARFGGPTFNDLVLKYIGMTSMLYVIFDIKDDLISRNISESDASRLGEKYFGNSMFWGILWLVIAIVYAVIILKFSFNKRIMVGKSF